MKAVLRVTVGDLTLRNSEVEDLEVVQELGEHTRCALTFVRDAALDIQIDQLLGKPLRVTVQGDDDDAVEIFQGTIADGSQTHLLNLGSKFRLEAISPSVRLEYRDTVYFRDSTVSTIAGKFGVKIVGQLRREPQRPTTCSGTNPSSTSSGVWPTNTAGSSIPSAPRRRSGRSSRTPVRPSCGVTTSSR
ncbi:MAG: hypothetical protein R2882_04500 [Gemmatimonadales bacterium]